MKQKVMAVTVLSTLFASVVLLYAILGVYSPSVGVGFTLAAFAGGFWLRGAWNG